MSTPRRRPRWHRLRRNHGCETPSSLLFVDTECIEEVVRTHPRKVILRFRLACLTYLRYDKGEISRRDTLDTSDWQEVWQWIESKQSRQRPLWVMGHNLGFDLTQLNFWQLAQLGRFRLGLTTPEESNGILRGQRSFRGRLCIEGFPFFVYALGMQGVCKFVDSSNYYPFKLSDLGDEIGLPKLPMPEPWAPESEWYTYCRRDVDIVERLMCETMDCWRATDGGVWQPTAAMLALTSFRHKLPQPRTNGTEAHILYDDRDEWSELERQGYYGGQVTCFYIGPITSSDDPRPVLEAWNHDGENRRPCGPLYLLDVRSLYPSVMRSNLYPFRRLDRKKEVDPAVLLKWMGSYGAIASVRIVSDGDEYTVRTPKGQLQATGQFDTVLCGPELLRALRAGRVKRVYMAQTYCMDDLFSQWVDDWVAVRDEADSLGKGVKSRYAKMILNSLSGKFAQSGTHWIDRPERVPPYDFGTWLERDHESGLVREMRSVCGVTQERVMGDPPWYTFPAISAYITAHGREHMRELRQRCPVDSVLYQATDSLLVTQAGYDYLVSSGEVKQGVVGKLQLKESAEYGEVLGCNHYRVGERWVRAGSWGKAVRQDDGTYTYQSFQGTASVLQSQPDGTVTVDEVELKRIDPYHKGTVGEMGWVKWPRL